MAVQTVSGWDATHSGLPGAPKAGQAAGYITGSPDIVWTASDRVAHPGFVQIDQSPVITAVDVRADVFDVESGAVTVAEVAQVVRAGQAAFNAAARPGQRWPAVYCSRSNVTQIANALLAGGVMSCPLWVADWNNNLAQATAEVAAGSGPFPVVGRQYANLAAYDADVFSVPWLTHVSGPHPAGTPSPPPGQWKDPGEWAWQQAAIIGKGLDGNMHAFVFDPAAGAWVRVIG